MPILALDLDGTCVQDSGVITCGTIASIQAAKEQGWIVCFVTGRRDIDMLPIEKASRVADYLLMNNGGKLVRTADEKVMHNTMINREDAARLVSLCLEKQWQIYAVSGKRWWVNIETPAGIEYAESLGVHPGIFTQPGQNPLGSIEGFMVTSDGDAVAGWIAQNNLELEVLYSEPGCIDVMQKGVTKWQGIQLLASLENIPLSQTIAMGNYTNDIDMIRRAGVGVAVQSALEEVKRAADYVTDLDHNNNAVGEVVGRFIKGRVFG